MLQHFNASKPTIIWPLISHLMCVGGPMEGPMEGPVVEQAIFAANLYQAKGKMGYNKLLDMVLQAMPNQLAAASPLLHHGHIEIIPIPLHPHFVTQYHFSQIIIRSSSSIGTHIVRVPMCKDDQTIWVK
jgi:hypothetical protein